MPKEPLNFWKFNQCMLEAAFWAAFLFDLYGERTSIGDDRTSRSDFRTSNGCNRTSSTQFRTSNVLDRTSPRDQQQFYACIFQLIGYTVQIGQYTVHSALNTVHTIENTVQTTLFTVRSQKKRAIRLKRIALFPLLQCFYCSNDDHYPGGDKCNAADWRDGTENTDAC